MTEPVLNIQPASLAEIVPVLQASAQARQERGQPIWTQAALSPETLAAQYPNGQVYAAQVGGETVAAMILVPTDAHYWPHDPPGEALYLHKLAVHPRWQGRGLSRQMLDAAVRLTREAKRPWLRLDTAAERPALRAVYEGYGFVCVREGELHGWPAAWYELKVGPRP